MQKKISAVLLLPQYILNHIMSQLSRFLQHIPASKKHQRRLFDIQPIRYKCKKGVLPRLERGASRKLCLGFTLSELVGC
jgi:hypothetical protein